MSEKKCRLSEVEVILTSEIHELAEMLNAKILAAKLSGIDVSINTTVFNDVDENSFVGVTYRMTAEVGRSSFTKYKPSHWADAINKYLHKTERAIIEP